MERNQPSVPLLLQANSCMHQAYRRCNNVYRREHGMHEVRGRAETVDMSPIAERVTE
jgi:hypothetical protein